MFCWRGVTPKVIPDSILTPSLRVRTRRPRHAEETSTHDQPDPHPTPPRHRNHPRDRHPGLRTSRLGRAALHHLRHLRLPLPRRPPQATRPLPQLDPQGRRQDHHPTPQRRAAGPLPALVPSPPTPTRATHRTRDPLPGDHRDRTATSDRPQKAQPQTATKNTAHLGGWWQTRCFGARQKRWGDPAPKPRVNMPKESDLPPLRCPILPLFRGCSPPSGTERVRPPKDTSLLGSPLTLWWRPQVRQETQPSWRP